MANQRLNIDIVAKDRSKKALTGLQGSLSRLKASVFNLRNAFIGLGAGLVIRNIVNTGKQIENLQVQLKFLFGSAQEGAKAFDEMAKFAAKVPFSLEEIQKGSGVLAVVSEDADELAHLMKITGNVAAVTGLDFKTTAEQIQRSLSAGISAADLFRDKGVKDMLGFKAGATASIEETAAAFDRVFGEGGKFDGATDELAKTFSGTLSMIGDKVFNFKRILLDAGFFSELKRQFGDLNKFLEDNAKQIEEMAITIGKNLAIAIVNAAKAIKILTQNFRELIDVLGILLVAFGGTIKILVGVGLILNNLNKRIRDLLGTAKEVVNPFEETAKAGEKIIITTKKQTKELEKQKKIYFNIFESHRKLIEAVDDYNLRHRTTVEILRDLNEETLKDMLGKFKDIKTIIAEGINNGITKFSDALARSIILGEKLGETFRKMAQTILVSILSYMIEMGIRLAIDIAYQKIKTMWLERQKNIMKDQLRIQTAMMAMSGNPMALIGLLGFQHGGAVSKGQPAIVGERGPELFIPNSSGQITQNARGTGGSPVNVNFSITTLDATGFNDMLINNRGTISSIINEAVNERGSRSIV